MAICVAHPPSLEAWALSLEPGRALMLKGTEGSERGPERGSSPSSQVTSAFGLILRARPAYGQYEEKWREGTRALGLILPKLLELQELQIAIM